MDTKKQRNRPAVVSIGCSGIKSFLRTVRRHFIPPQNDLQLPSKPKSTIRSTVGDLLSNSSPKTAAIGIAQLRNGGLMALQAYVRRAQQLEFEINQLGQWLEAEHQLRDLLVPSPGDSFSLPISSSATAENNFSVKLRNMWDHHVAEEQREKALNCRGLEAIKLGNGNYIHTMQMRTPSRKLIMQFSEPALVSTDAGSTTSEILHSMASLGPKKLFSRLHQLMPLVEISSDALKEMNGRQLTQGTASGFLENILVSALNNMDDLIVEGLRIQAGMPRGGRISKIKPRVSSADQINAVALLRPTHPYNAPYSAYEAIGDVMFVLIDTFVLGDTKFWINSITVAGVTVDTNENLGEDAEELDVQTGRRFRERSHRFLLWSVGKTARRQRRTQLFRYEDIIFGDD